MGLTVGCARCHDHKFDPIPTADYYSLYGVFQNCTERLVPIAEPVGRAPPPAFREELAGAARALRDGPGREPRRGVEAGPRPPGRLSAWPSAT